MRRGEGVGGRQGPFPLALQLGLQRVEGFDVGQLDHEGLLARVAHDQQHEAVTVDDVHGAVLGLFVDIVSPLKIEGAKRFRCVIYNFLNIAYHIVVTLPEELRHFQRGGGGASIVQHNRRRGHRHEFAL